MKKNFWKNINIKKSLKFVLQISYHKSKNYVEIFRPW